MKSFFKILLYVISLFFSIAVINLSTLFAQNTPDYVDLIEYSNPQSVDISPNGENVLVSVRNSDIATNSNSVEYLIYSSNGDKEPKKLDLPQQVSSVEWYKNSNKIVYLAPAEQTQQVWMKNLSSDSTQKITDHPTGVNSFEISDSGNKIAFTAIAPSQRNKDGSSQSRRGIEVDLLTTNGYQIPKISQNNPEPPVNHLFIQGINRKDSPIKVEGISVRQFSWSPNENYISLISPVNNKSLAGIPDRGNSVHLYDLENNSLKLILEGNQPQNTFHNNVVGYSQLTWSPSGKKIAFIRQDYTDRFAAVPEMGIYNLENESARLLTKPDEYEIFGAQLQWHNNETIYFEHTNQARRGLYSINIESEFIEPVYRGDDRKSSFSYSKNRNNVSWIEQSSSQAPEIFISSADFSSIKQVSNLNSELNSFRLPEAESVEWKSKDGVKAQGWYIPAKVTENDGPPPMVTIVHGGPSVPMLNQFQPYLNYWPFPVHKLSAEGIAVFFPNYRGTPTFGKDFRQPNEFDQEPVDDIITGIEHLVNSGLADKNKLGIAGHSHGGWLAPIVAAEYPNFKAGSFAEGFGSFLSVYGKMPGIINLDLHEYDIGESVYENTERYIELSPIFRDDLTKNIPALLEFGQQSPIAAQSVEFGKAFWRHDTPHQVIVYPDANHNLVQPVLIKESMERNVEWFNKWLGSN